MRGTEREREREREKERGGEGRTVRWYKRQEERPTNNFSFIFLVRNLQGIKELILIESTVGSLLE